MNNSSAARRKLWWRAATQNTRIPRIDGVRLRALDVAGRTTLAMNTERGLLTKVRSLQDSYHFDHGGIPFQTSDLRIRNQQSCSEAVQCARSLVPTWCDAGRPTGRARGRAVRMNRRLFAALPLTPSPCRRGWPYCASFSSSAAQAAIAETDARIRMAPAAPKYAAAPASAPPISSMTPIIVLLTAT